jgi:hypothetical protein
MPPEAPPVAVAALTQTAGLPMGTSVQGLDGWQHGDIGAVLHAGSVEIEDNTIRIKASGTDIYNQTDEGLFIYRCLRGDGSLTVRVQSIVQTDPWAKLGVMFRESLAGNARNAFMFVSANNARVMTYRAGNGTNTTSCPHGPVAPLPCWIRLTREGNSFTSYYSGDGAQWTRLGSITLAMGKDVYACLAGSSHQSSTITTIVVDSFKWEGTPTPVAEWPALPSAPAP